MSKHKVFGESDSEEYDDLEGKDEEEKNSDVEEDLLVESDSDSAPEDIGFEMGKATALKQVKDALLQMDVKKVKAKERRKRQEELFKQQKKQKLEALAKSRLPDDILEQLSKEPVKSDAKTSAASEATQEKHSEDEGDSEDDDDDDNLDSGAEDEDDEEEEEEDGNIGGMDYMPIESGTDFKVVAIKEDLKKLKPSGLSAKEFRENMLYGNRVKRHSEKDRQGQIQKKMARYR